MTFLTLKIKMSHLKYTNSKCEFYFKKLLLLLSLNLTVKDFVKKRVCNPVHLSKKYITFILEIIESVILKRSHILTKGFMYTVTFVYITFTCSPNIAFVPHSIW